MIKNLSTPTPHIHAAVIMAWAAGEEIEFRNSSIGRWKSTTNPTFKANAQYRVKPDLEDVEVFVDADTVTRITAKSKMQGNLVLSFDKRTGKLVEAVILEDAH